MLKEKLDKKEEKSGKRKSTGGECPNPSCGNCHKNHEGRTLCREEDCVADDCKDQKIDGKIIKP